MRILIEFLLYEMCSSNGMKGSAQPIMDELFTRQTAIGKFNQRFFSSLDPEDINLIKIHNQNKVIQDVCLRFKIARIRMKISYMAY